MKKFVVVLLLMTLLFSLSGCSVAPKLPPKDLVADTIAAIDAIGDISDTMPLQPLEKEEAIKTAKKLYEELTTAQRSKVTNAEKLTAAQNLLSTASILRTDAQYFANNLFKVFASTLKNSDTIKVKNVWFWTLDGKSNHYYTFQFDIENAQGNAENVYYCTSSAIDNFDIGNVGTLVINKKIMVKGTNVAKDDGVKLDAWYTQSDLESYLKR